MDNVKRALSMLSLTTKAGKLVSGGFMTEQAIQTGNAFLVIIANDASDNTKKKFIDKCTYYRVPYVLFADSNMIGNQIGKGARMTIAITDEGLAKQIHSKIDSSKDMEV